MEPTVPTPKREPGVYQGNPPSPLEKKEESTPPLIRTMKNDVAEAIRKQNETFVSIALAEEKKQFQARNSIAMQTQTAEVSSRTPRPIGRMVIVIVFFLVAATVGLAYKFILPKFNALQTKEASLSEIGTSPLAETAEVTQVNTSLAPALIPPQYEKRFILNKETPEHLFATVAVERTAGVVAGAINNLYFTEETTSADGAATTAPISANRLLSFAKIDMPEILARSLEAPFMAGLLGESGSSATPFLILKVSDYDTGLAGILIGERSLVRLFDTIFGTRIQASGTEFRDVVILGKDARAFDIISGTTIIYSFANPNTIVIAGSRSALEILLPLAAK